MAACTQPPGALPSTGREALQASCAWPSAKALCPCPLRELLMFPQLCSGCKIADGHITKPETLKCFLE